MALARQFPANETYTKFYKNPSNSSVAATKLETNTTCTVLTHDLLSAENALLYCITDYGLEAYLHSFLNSPVEGALWSLSHSGRFKPGREMPIPIEEQTEWVTELLRVITRREKSRAPAWN